METKEEMLRRMNKYEKHAYLSLDPYEKDAWFRSRVNIDDNGLAYWSNEQHPLYSKVERLYNLLKKKNGPHHWVNSILLDMQQYGIRYKVKKVDLIAMNKMYKEYK
tara:strand:+ start:2544 stop:2861 length:318 start_codon:yes stop_codon:yes gene_type:complete